uniref:VWFA domain-containing protein n=1 Tax=Trichobilharzia regenti TaxID=157069 RepID=A0AA85IUC7_TRIRE|nr:unnamed protein product [Trichobilharzia regenti]
MSDFEDDNGILIQRLYACYSKNEIISPEALITWYIDYLNSPFVFDKKFNSISFVMEASKDIENYPFQLVAFCATGAPYDDVILRFSEKTDLFCLHHCYRFCLVIDFSWSALCSSVDGTCYINGILGTIKQLLHILSESSCYTFPGTGYKISDVTIYISVIVVVPHSQCYTLISGWVLDPTDIVNKIAHISRSVFKLERKFLENMRNEHKHFSDRNQHVSLSDLLRHGTLSVSLLAPTSAPATIIFLTDGCFSTSDFGVPELVMSHLNLERVRCVFILIADNITSRTLKLPISYDVFKQSSFMSAGIQQVELCNLLARNTSGFVISVPNESRDIGAHLRPKELTESLLAVPIIHHGEFDVSNNDFICGPRVTVKASSKLIELPTHTMLMTRLKSGFRLRTASLSRKNLTSKNPLIAKEKTSVCVKNDQVDASVPLTEKEKASIDCMTEIVKLDLEMVWGVSTIFHCSIVGEWTPFLQSYLARGTAEFSAESREDAVPIRCSASHSAVEKSWVELKIEANYSFIQEFVNRHSLNNNNLVLPSKFSHLPLPVQMTALNDILLVHVYEFNKNSAVRQIPNAFSSRLYPVFVVKNNHQGDLLAAPTLTEHQPTSNRDSLSFQRFIDYWRFFIDIDLLQCYRWMSLHHIFVLLEHDSLPSNLHFPLSEKRDTSPLSCRQALFRVHTLLSQWSSFVLLENSTYVKLFHVRDFLVERHMHQSNSLPSVSSVPLTTQESVDSTKAGDCDTDNDKTCSGVSASSVSHFCVIRLELRIPEVRFIIGFVSDTPTGIQRDIVEYLKMQLVLLRFPPRGRQAIPKSRHKSGTFQHVNEFKHVPPLQRSWEDTPCCTIFQTRLDRLAIDSGTFCNQAVRKSGYVSTDRKHSVNITSAQESERLMKICKRNRLLFLRSSLVTHPTISSLLLAQHLHHSVCVWAVFSTTSKSCIHSIFSSFVNIRLQEGFHLARVGPQPGFVSLFTELEMQQTPNSQSKTPCLVQYQVYPIVDPRNIRFQAHELGHLTILDTPLRTHVNTVVSGALNLFDNHPITNIENFVFSPIIIVSEIWIQPVSGTVNSTHLEAKHWLKSTFTKLPRIIFNEDEGCIIPYATLDNIYSLVSKKSKTYNVSHATAALNSKETCFSVEPSPEIRLAYSSISKLLPLSPNLIVLLPLLGQITNKKFSSSHLSILHNENLISSLHLRLMKSGSLMEIPVPMNEVKDIFSQWGYDAKSGSRDNSEVEFPNLRCFVGRGLLKQQTNSNVFDEPNPMVIIILVPSTLKDAFHPIFFSVINSHLKSLEVSQPSLPCLPVFMYVCSRVYMSYLVDDKWTYKAPDTHIINMCSNDQGLLMSDRHDCGNVDKLNLLSGAVPDCFLNVGCQNHRLTQELRALWSDLMFAFKLLEHSHSYAYSVSIYRILEAGCVADVKDVKYMLKHSQDYFPLLPLTLDITSFTLYNCSHLFTYVQLIHQKSNNYVDECTNIKFVPTLGHEKRKQLMPPLLILDPEDLVVNFSISSSENCDCCKVQKNCLYTTFCEYLIPVPNLDGVYVLSKPKQVDRDSQTLRLHISQDVPESSSKIMNTVKSEEIKSQVTPSVSCASSATCKMFAEASAESDAVWDSRNMKSQKTVSSFDRCHSISQSSDLLVRKLVDWFHLVSGNTSDICPLFLRFRGVLNYKGMSCVVPLYDGLPVFCAAHFRETLSQLILRSASKNDMHLSSTDSNSVLTIDLGQLNFYVEIQPIINSHYDFSLLRTFQDSDVYRKLHEKSVKEAQVGYLANFTYSIYIDPADMPQNYMVSKSHFINTAYSTMEEECVTIDDWLKQSDISKIPSKQQCFLRLFVFQILWQLHDSLVNCLRSLTPITEQSLEIILRHIEDTCKAMNTPLFNPSNILVNHSCMSSTEEENLKPDAEYEKSCVFQRQCTIVQNFRNLKKEVVMQRIRLDFVLDDTEVVDQFTKYFESMLVSHSYGRPYYVNGYYYLSNFNGGCGNNSESRYINICEGEKGDLLSCSNNTKFGLQPSVATVNKYFSFHNFSSANVSTAFTSPTETRLQSQKSKTQDHQGVVNIVNRWSMKRKRSSSYSVKKNTNLLRRSHSFPVNGSRHTGEYSENVFKNSCIRPSVSLSRANVLDKCLDSPVLHERVQSINNFLPFWFIFRISSNSVSIFFHHTDSHVSSFHNESLAIPTSLTLEQKLYEISSDKLPVECDYCNIYQNVVNSIHSLIRMLNQKLLLAKLCDERLCDDLLLPADESDVVVKCDSSNFYDCNASVLRNGSVELTNSYGWKIRSKRRARPFIRYIPLVEKQKLTLGEKKLNNYPNIPSNIGKCDRMKSTTAYNVIQYPVNSCDQLKSLNHHVRWSSGIFACPVQMTSYIRLHPRVFLNSQIYPVEKGRRIIPALRQLLENLAITNRSNMFFLIDHPSKSDSNSISTKKRKHAYCDSDFQSVYSVTEYSQQPVFYMLLKEVTTTTFLSEHQPSLLDKQATSKELKKPSEFKLVNKTSKSRRVCSDISTSAYFGSSEQSVKSIHKGIRFTSTSKIAYDHNSHVGENYLQITLHGISPPSRNLCASVHHMLQSRLDGLVLQQISDSLSRNAINRLTMEDFMFLLNRRPEQPHLHFFISLPKFLTDNDQSLFGITVPYKPSQTVLAFCHYFRQNLLLFLTPVKLDRDTKALLKGLGKAELFLFNRPSAQGFSKHGVATVLFQLMMVSSDKAPHLTHSPLEPYVILDWASPDKFLSTNKTCNLCFQDMLEAIKDFCEVSESDLQNRLGLIQPLPRLILSVRMWERGHSDLDNLKMRLMASVHHALYDLMTEYLVLTSPIFFDSEYSSIISSSKTLHEMKNNDLVVLDTGSKYVSGKDASQNPLILPWMKEGRAIESPLISTVFANLSSSLFVEQFVSDLLKPFISHDEALIVDGASNNYRKLSPSLDINCSSNVSNATANCPEASANSSVKHDSKFGENVDVSKPGLANKYIIVGYNLNAWRKICRPLQTGQDYKLSNFPQTFNQPSGIRLIEFISDSGTQYDASSRMQPLKVNISSNQYASVSVSNNDPNINLKRINRNDETCAYETRFSPGSDSKRRSVQQSDPHCSPTDNSYSFGSLVSKFPEFCPVKIGMVRQVTRHPSAEASVIPNLSQNDRSNSNECLNQNSPLTREKCKMSVHIPRQSFCLININGRLIEMYTYNWTKEEAERLSNRLLLLVDWYNQRYQLLCSFSFQKLGLFHAISNPSFRVCAARATDLIRNNCPPELNIGTDSSSATISQTQTSSHNLPSSSSVASSFTAQTSVSSGAMNLLSAVVSVARRRHATTSSSDVVGSINNTNISCSPAHFNSSLFPTHSVSTHGTGNCKTENKGITNLLRLFQDCGNIPLLLPPGNPHSPYTDILHRYGKQVTTLMEADVLQSQYIEMFSLPFRAWQEDSKCCTTSMDSDSAKPLSFSKDVGQKFTHSKSSIRSSEAILANEQVSKRLQRYSAIKQACRHLHTICTPILFCPSTRSKVVQLMKEEENAMNRTAQLYFSTTVNHSVHSYSCSATTTTTNTNTTATKTTNTTTATTTVTVTNSNSSVTDSTSLKETGVSDNLCRSDEQTTDQCKLSGNDNSAVDLKLKQIPDTNSPGNRFLSPWLSWSHNSSTPNNLDDSSLITSDTLLKDNDLISEKLQHNDGHTSVTNFNNWLRRVAHNFLMKYSQYLQQEVGFYSVPILNSQVTQNRREHTTKLNVKYALFRRSIHLAGVHIIELFIRKSHLFVRLGTIEVSRFSWHASRSVTMGPYTSEVISQAAASAAASMTSVMFNAVFRRNMEKSLRSHNSSFDSLPPPFDHQCSDWMQYGSNISWNESSKLCDYTHLHSFSYDFHLHAIQDYLGNRRCCHRGQCSDASRRSASTTGRGYANVIDIPDYPVTKFLEDLSCLAQKLPLFSRGYLCCFPVTCHVSLCLRPDQVFHHLIEEHACYGVDILRMSRSEGGIAQANQIYNKHLSYNFALVEQCHPEQESSCSSSRSSNSDHQSKHQPCANLRTSSESHSTSCNHSALGIANTHQIVEDLAKLDRESSNLHSLPQPYSVTGIVVPDEINGTYSDIRSPVDGSITNRLLHLTVYLIILDSKHEFPESRLAKLNSGSCTQCPVDWPAVRPCLDPFLFSYQSFSCYRSLRSFGSEDVDVSSYTVDRHYQNLPPTYIGDYRKFLKHSKNTPDSDVRWHMSYLSMCPSHQVQLHRVLRISQSNLESRITQLIARSGVDCHKNLLWYKLFDTNSTLATQILSTNAQSLFHNIVESNFQTESTPSITLGANSNPMDSYVCPVLNHRSLSMREIEDLVDSAPFQLDILRLDPRLLELFEIGACHLNTVSSLLNREFVDSQQNNHHHQTEQAKLDSADKKLYKYSTSETIACIAYRFSHSAEDKPSDAGVSHNSIKNYMVLLSPSFTEGLIFLSWCEEIGEYSSGDKASADASNEASTSSTRSRCIDAATQKTKTAAATKYKDFQFRAVFRAVGDPTNPSSMRRLIDSGIEIQNLFFKTSTLALVATNFIEKLSFLVWKTLHN